MGVGMQHEICGCRAAGGRKDRCGTMMEQLVPINTSLPLQVAALSPLIDKIVTVSGHSIQDWPSDCACYSDGLGTAQLNATVPTSTGPGDQAFR